MKSDRAKNIPTEALPMSILNAIISADKPLSRLEICEALGRKKSPHILTMIDTLHAEGWLTKRREDTRNRTWKWVYWLGDTYWTWIKDWEREQLRLRGKE